MTGIAAKFTGKCTVCKAQYRVGDLIDRANENDTGRAHVGCIKNAAANGRANPEPAAAATTGAGSDLDAMREGIVQTIEASKTAANAIDAMREGMEATLAALDALIARSHQTTTSSRR